MTYLLFGLRRVSLLVFLELIQTPLFVVERLCELMVLILLNKQLKLSETPLVQILIIIYSHPYYK